MKENEIKDLVNQMTLEEKVSMCSGADFWNLKGVERLGIPSVMVSDGPHGLRKQDEASDHLGVNESIKAVCFPAGCATASSFDRNVVRCLGEAIGKECQAEGVSTILGPAVNIKRSPLCGRNFEYYSEDPFVSTEMATAFIQGVQSQNIGTSIKHFLANNQEKRRTTNSSQVDERTLREIYLAAFEGAVKNAKPWTVMSSYNLVNGTYVGESRKYLTDILRDEWGFDGYVMSDWGAVNDRLEALKAGLDLEMPSSNGSNDALLINAVKEGKLDENVLNHACERIINVIFRYTENRKENRIFEYENDHRLSAEIEEECIVLLKNEDDILPLSADKKIAFIGKYAEEPRYQGGGSSHINSWKVESALDAVADIAEVVYAKGFDDAKDEIDEGMQMAAVEAAQIADAAVIFAGLPDIFESEGYDRTHIGLPNCQNTLIEKICGVQKNTIVVLHNGAPISMPWKDKVKGIVEAYLGGQAVGKAVVDILYGKANPSGRLAETFPRCLEDTPCYLTYGKGVDRSEYMEGVFVGYRYYVSKNQDVLFPFGYGLSYTTFAYSNLCIDKMELLDTETLNVTVDVENTGDMKGKEVVQLYVAPPAGSVSRPVKELRGFEKIELEAGEKKTVTFQLSGRAFSYWNAEIFDWFVENGEYQIQVCKNANEVILWKQLFVKNTKKIQRRYHMNTCLGDLMQDKKAKAVFMKLFEGNQQTAEMETEKQNSSGAINSEMIDAMMNDMPLRQLLSFFLGTTRESLEQLLVELNK